MATAPAWASDPIVESGSAASSAKPWEHDPIVGAAKTPEVAKPPEAAKPVAAAKPGEQKISRGVSGSVLEGLKLEAPAGMTDDVDVKANKFARDRSKSPDSVMFLKSNAADTASAEITKGKKNIAEGKVSKAGLPEWTRNRVNEKVGQAYDDAMRVFGLDSNHIAGNLAGVTDVGLQIGGSIVSSLLGSFEGVLSASAGRTHEDTQRDRKEATEKYMSQAMWGFENPVHSLMEKAGYGEQYDKADVTKALRGFAGNVNSAAEGLSKITGGVLGVGDAEDLINAAINFVVPAAMRLSKAVGKWKANRPMSAEDAAQFKPIPRYTYDPLVELPAPEHPAGAGRGTQGVAPEAPRPDAPRISSEKQVPPKPETVSPAKETPPVGAEGPLPTEVTERAQPAMSQPGEHDFAEGSHPVAIDVPSRVISEVNVSTPQAAQPHVEAIVNALQAVAAAPIAGAALESTVTPSSLSTATPSTEEGRKPYATSIGNDNVKVADKIANDAMGVYKSLPQVFKLNAGDIHKDITGNLFKYKNAMEEAKKLSGTERKAKIQAARFYYGKMLIAETKIKNLSVQSDKLKAKDRQLAKAAFNEKNTDNWVKTGDQKGSNVGGFYTTPDGKEYYVKTPQSEAHTNNELLAGHLYDLAGTPIARTHEVTHNGKSSVASLIEHGIVPGAKSNTPGIKENFAVDAWLSNWDVAGMNMDNIHTDSNGAAFRLDLGGSMMYRAQGGTKPFGQIVHEFNTLRDPIKAPQASKLFGKMTDQDLIASIGKVEAITPHELAKTVMKYGPKDPVENDKLLQTLTARRADLIKRKHQLEGKVPSPVASLGKDLFPKPNYAIIPTHKATQADKGIGAEAFVSQALPDYDHPDFPQWLRDQMNSEAFKEMFARSKDLDAHGRPKIRYHGTPKNLKTGQPEDYLAFKQSDLSAVGEKKGVKSGVFTAEDFDNAKQYANKKGVGEGGVLAVFVNTVKPFDHLNPKHLSQLEHYLNQKGQKYNANGVAVGSYPALENETVIKALKAMKFDAFYTKEGPGRNLSALVRENVKNVKNAGKWNPKNPNMFGKGTPEYLLGLAAAAAALAYLTQEKAEAADDVGDRPVDMYEAGLYVLAAVGLAALLIKNGGMGKIEMTTSIEDVWKPDFNKLLDPRSLGRAFQWTKQSAQADTTYLWQRIKEARLEGVTEALDAEFRNVTEDPKLKATLGQHKMDLYNKYSGSLLKSIAVEMNKIIDPTQRQVVWNEIETRVAINHRAWWDSIINDSSGSGPRGFQKSASAMKDRTVFALADGTIITVKKMVVGDKWKVTGWKNNTRTDLGTTTDRPVKGADFAGQKVVSAKQQDIEKHTPIRYIQSDLATLSVKLSELRKYNRENDMMVALLASPNAHNLFAHQKYGQIPADYVQPEGVNSIPALAGVFMPKAYAEVVSDFIKNNKGNGSIVDGLNNILIRALMINPYPHISNEMLHWYDSRGISGFITPTGIPGGASKGLYGLAVTLPGAIRSVIVQDKFQTELQKSGGFLLYPAVKNQKAWKSILQMSLRQALQTGSLTEMALAIGSTPGKLMTRISDGSAGLMWAVRDIMYTQLVKEQMLMGKDMHEAATEVGKHMPEYYIPSRIITQRPIGRVLQKIVASKLNIFQNYHYGLMRALTEIGKDLLIGGTKDKIAGLDRAAALIIALLILFPAIDQINKKITKAEDEGEAKQRRPGALHILSAAGEVYNGERDIGSLAVSLFTPNPVIMTAFEAIQNHSLYNGKPIRSEGAPWQVQAAQTARYLATKIAPIQTTDDIYTGRVTFEQYMWKQLDILVKTEEQLQKQQEWKEGRKEAGQASGERFMQTYGMESE